MERVESAFARTRTNEHPVPRTKDRSVMASPRKTWREKLEADKGLPKVTVVDRDMLGVAAGTRLLIPSGPMVEAAIRAIPRGKVIPVAELRAGLARAAGAAAACPLVTGIFCNLAARAAEEEAEAGASVATPWWRVLAKPGKVNPKFPGAPDLQIERLRAEGVELGCARPSRARRTGISKNRKGVAA